MVSANSRRHVFCGDFFRLLCYWVGAARPAPWRITVSFLFLIIFFCISFLIVGLVLLQEGKGGGLTGMSAGMDGVMGAKNPLRRMTAYLFAIFVVMCIFINWYFYQRVDASLPSGLNLPEARQTLETTAPLAIPVGPAAVSEGGLRPEVGAQTPDESAPEQPAPSSDASE